MAALVGRAFWNCCTAKKGYSGTAVFVKDSLAGAVQAPAGGDDKAAKGGGQQQKVSAFFKKKDNKPEAEGGAKEEGGALAKLLDVNLGFLDHDSNAEGRVICCEFDKVRSPPPPEERGTSQPAGLTPAAAVCLSVLVCSQLFVVGVYVPNSGMQLERLQVEREGGRGSPIVRWEVA